MHHHPIRTDEVRVEAFDFQVVHLFATARELYRHHHAAGAEAVELFDGVAGREFIDARPAGHVAVGGRFDEERVLLGGLNRRERVAHRRIDGHERDKHDGRALPHVGLEHFTEGELAGFIVVREDEVADLDIGDGDEASLRPHDGWACKALWATTLDLAHK